MASGATEGLTEYDKQALMRQQQLRELNKTTRGEDVESAKLSALETGQDKRAAAMEAAATARYNMGFKAPQAEYQMTTMLANELHKKDPSLGPGEAYALARSKINSGMYGADMRADSAAKAKEADIYKTAELSLPGSGPRAVQMWRAQQGGSGGSDTGGLNRGGL